MVGVDWFSREVARKIGNGRNSSFWNDAWRDTIPLSIKFPRLYSISNNQEAKVSELWVLVEGVS